MSFVEIKNLEKSFGDTKVLKKLNLNIEEGEFITCLLYTSPSPRDQR